MPGFGAAFETTRRGDRFAGTWFAPAICLLLTSQIFLAGCKSHGQRIADYRQDFFDGELASAATDCSSVLEKSPRNRPLIQLDQSMVLLANGDPQGTENLLRVVRDEFENQPLRDLNQLTSWVVDDENRTYRLDDYERLFLHVFLALSNLLQDGDDAFAYSNQITAVQQEIEQRLNRGLANRTQSSGHDNASHHQHGHDNAGRHHAGHHETNVSAVEVEAGINEGTTTTSKAAKLPNFQRVALAPYIAGLLHEQTHRDYDSAAFYFQKAFDLDPKFELASLAANRARHGTHSRKGHGVLHVFVAVGKGPHKIQVAEEPTSTALLIADRILSEVGDQTLPPTIAPIKTARVVVPENPVDSILVRVNDQPAGQTQVATDLGQIARQQNLAKLDLDIARAVVRRILKKSVVYAGKDALGTSANSLPDLLLNVGGVLWEAAESADTRCWSLLPERIEVVRLELPVGPHRISLQPILRRSARRSEIKATHQPVETTPVDVDIIDGKNTYLFANFPGLKLVGKVQVSR